MLRIRIQLPALILMRRHTPQQHHLPNSHHAILGIHKHAQRDIVIDARVYDLDVAVGGQAFALDGGGDDGGDEREHVNGFVAGGVGAGDGD